MSCKAKGQSIQIVNTHPTNIFTVDVEKKFMEAEEMKEEVWTIKVSIGQIIELANKLNIKYSA